jgi:hypothetical protein
VLVPTQFANLPVPASPAHRCATAFHSVLPAGITLVREFTSDEVVSSVAVTMNLITGAVGASAFPARLPSNVAVRHRLCTALANAVKVCAHVRA